MPFQQVMFFSDFVILIILFILFQSEKLKMKKCKRELFSHEFKIERNAAEKFT